MKKGKREWVQRLVSEHSRKNGADKRRRQNRD
jgi:hypothetical protein